MTRQRFIHIAATAAAVGGAAWVTKFAVVAATDGDSSITASVLYVLGVALMALGAAWVGVRLAGDRHVAIAVVLGLLSPLLFFLSYMLLDGVATTIVGDAGPSWLEDEVGIVLTGAAWLATSLARPSASLAVVPWR